MTNIGSIVSLWRYPIKSMLGEQLDTVAITPRGLAGDRAYALLDPSTGKIASAKNPSKWAKLFECHATLDGPTARITLPNGTKVTTSQADLNQVLSETLGREVKLLSNAPQDPVLEEYWPDLDGLAYRQTVTDETMAGSAPPGTFFDSAPTHLLTTATLDRFAELYPPGRFEVLRFRPNIVIQPASENGFVENGWLGRTLALGEEVQLRVVGPCPRCVMTTLAQGDLPADPGILRTAAQHNRVPQPSVGVYAVVSRGGQLRRGDTVWA
jgi:uncharacterized protein YcbX